MRTNLARATATQLKEQYGGILRIFKTHIPIAVKAAEISTVGESIFSYDKSSKVAQAYAKLTREVLQNGERNKFATTISR